MLKKLFPAFNVFLYRLTGGKLGGRSHRSKVLLLTTTGRKTGKSRTTPLRFIDEGDAFLVIASNWGQEQPPAWLLNLQDNPNVQVQDMDRIVKAKAVIAQGDEHTRLFEKLAASEPRYVGYQAGIKRKIAVVLLQPL
jgi:deazaflavin-dependent oxidoreductase (nitroreductase family)